MSPTHSASLAALLVLFAMPLAAQPAEPQVKRLAAPADPAKAGVLIGKATVGGMQFQFELEGAEGMWMLMGNPPAWGAHQPAANERYHVEFKLTDPKSRTRIPYADVVVDATNRTSGQTIKLPLAPMWGSSGLHYSANSALLGDGVYAATITVGVPTFERELKDKDIWSQPTSARFHFRLREGKVVEVTQPR